MDHHRRDSGGGHCAAAQDGASGSHARWLWKNTKARAAEAATAASSAKARPTAAPTAGVARRQRPRRAVTTRTVARCTKTCTAVAGIIWCPATSPAFHPEPCVVGRLSPASKGASCATLAQATRLIEIWTIKRQMDRGGLWRDAVKVAVTKRLEGL